MIIIPAIDIKNGKCVRLLQGRMEDETIFSDDPAATAKKWTEAGAEFLHVIDLDGAIKKSPQNIDSIRSIVNNCEIPIQVGGGIRNVETVRMYLSMGVKRIIIGSETINNSKFVKETCIAYPDKVVVAIDARNGCVAVDGWTRTTKIKAVDLAKQYEDCGVVAIIFTDIYRDGMQTGPNIAETRTLAEAISIPVIASGGVSTIDDIINLLPLESAGVCGVITGRALYSGSLDFKAALAVAQNTRK